MPVNGKGTENKTNGSSHPSVNSLGSNIHPTFIAPENQTEVEADSSYTSKTFHSDINSGNGKKKYSGVSDIHISYVEKSTQEGASKNSEQRYTTKLGLGDRYMSEKLITSVNFPTDKFDKSEMVNPEKIDYAIKEINKLLRENPNMKIRIEGNTDAMGDAKYNQNLSEHRAGTVNELILKGIDKDLKSRVYVDKTGNGENKLTEKTEGESLTNRNVTITAEVMENQRYYRVVHFDSKAANGLDGKPFNLEFISGKKASDTFLGKKGEHLSNTFVESSGSVVIDDVNAKKPLNLNVTISDPKNLALLVKTEDQSKVTTKLKSDNDVEISYNGRVIANVHYNVIDEKNKLTDKNLIVGALANDGKVTIKEAQTQQFAALEERKQMDKSVKDAIRNIDMSAIAMNTTSSGRSTYSAEALTTSNSLTLK